jgi:hypothetical protein
MRVAAVVSDLMLYSRIEAAATTVGADLTRVDSPLDVPHDVQLILVDWSANQPDWAAALAARRESGCRVVLFGPHTDLDAHSAARQAGLGPMMARSAFVRRLGDLLRGNI